MQSTAISMTIALLWVIWGLVHVFAGGVFMSSGTPDAVVAVAGPYHDAAGALNNQHGFNLLWIGLTTIMCTPFIWKGSIKAMFIAGLTGGLADVGHFVFIDLGGFVNVLPDTVMTLISAAAILLSIWIWNQSRSGVQGGSG